MAFLNLFLDTVDDEDELGPVSRNDTSMFARAWMAGGRLESLDELPFCACAHQSADAMDSAVWLEELPDEERRSACSCEIDFLHEPDSVAMSEPTEIQWLGKLAGYAVVALPVFDVCIDYFTSVLVSDRPNTDDVFDTRREKYHHGVCERG